MKTLLGELWQKIHSRDKTTEKGRVNNPRDYQQPSPNVGAVFIDNATVRSAARALGMTPLRPQDKALFDLDIASAGMLVESLILFDTVYLLNTKPATVFDKNPVFKASPFAFLPVSEESIAKLETAAIESVKSRKLSFGETEAEFQPLRELMKAVDLHLGWLAQEGSTVESSRWIYFTYVGLTSKYTGPGKMDFEHLRERFDDPLINEPDESTLLSAVDGWHLYHEARKASKSTRLLQNIAWLLIRTAFYQGLTATFGIPYQPHHIRARLLQFNVISDQLQIMTNTHKADGSFSNKVYKELALSIVKFVRGYSELGL